METNCKVIFITGAGRGLGLEITKAALAAGHKVIATGRNIEAVSKNLGEHSNLLIEQLDVTSFVDAENAADAAVEKFGKIDVLINNAANCITGYFEELTQDQIWHQLHTSLIGPMNVTRAVLPIMRQQRSGHIISISSAAGLSSVEFCSAYSAAKFGMEGWMKALKGDVTPFGINTTVINPGVFRTEFLTDKTMTFADNLIDDYNGRREEQEKLYREMDGNQQGDPAKLAYTLIKKIVENDKPPYRFIAGSDAVTTAEEVIKTLQSELDAYKKLSNSLAF